MLLIMFMPCFVIAGVSAFSKNNGRRAVTTGDLSYTVASEHDMLTKKMADYHQVALLTTSHHSATNLLLSP